MILAHNKRSIRQNKFSSLTEIHYTRSSQIVSRSFFSFLLFFVKKFYFCFIQQNKKKKKKEHFFRQNSETKQIKIFEGKKNNFVREI